MPADALHERVQALLANRRSKGNLRALAPPSYDPSTLVDFSSNDYLSLAKSEALQKRFQNAVSDPARSSSSYGPASSRLLDGNSPLHIALEDRLAGFFQGEAALLFNSGFDANAGVFACLPAAGDAMLYDALIHASVHDGMRHSRCKNRRPFHHNSPQDLESTISDLLDGPDGASFANGTSQVFVAVEALYSMDGDLAPVLAFLDVIEKVLPNGNGHLIVDEAHSTGLYGSSGRGLVCSLGAEKRVLVRLHTFGKAMACTGGVIICSPVLRDYFINYARPLIFSTVMPYLMVTAIDAALAHLEAGLADQAIEQLHILARYCKDSLAAVLPNIPFVNLPSSKAHESTLSSTSPVIPILTPIPRELSSHLIKSGYLVRPIAHPTVPRGEERVRVCLHANNTKRQIDGLVAAIIAWAKQRSEDSPPAAIDARLSKL